MRSKQRAAQSWKALIPIDGSDSSKRALSLALKLLQNRNSALTAAYFIYEPIVYEGPPPLRPVKEINYARKVLVTAKRTARRFGISLETNVRPTHFDIGRAICREARRKSYDIIIMGTRGRKGIKRLLLGSVATTVITHAPCPVVVVR